MQRERITKKCTMYRHYRETLTNLDIKDLELVIPAIVGSFIVFRTTFWELEVYGSPEKFKPFSSSLL